MSQPTEPTARTLADLCHADGTTATFHAGLSGQTHHWMMRSPSGTVLAQTARVHRGGRVRQALWKLWNMTNMHVGDDIHVELRGADGVVLAKASSGNDTPAIVTVVDESGVQLARSVRDEKAFTVFGGDDRPIGSFDTDGDEPWQVADANGRVVGELLAGERDPSRKPGLAQWMLFTDVALDTVAHQQGQHRGIRKVVRYSYAPVGKAPVGQAPIGSAPVPVALALLPLLAGLTY